MGKLGLVRQVAVRRAVACLVVFGSMAGVAPTSGVPARAQEPDDEALQLLEDLQPWRRGDDPTAPPVPEVESAPKLKDEPLDAAVPEVKLPRPGKGTVELEGRRKRAGDTPVSLSAGAAKAKGKAVQVEVLDQSVAKRTGTSGFVFTLSGDDELPVDVAVDYSGFADAYGAGYGDRLELRKLPACALDEQPDPGCKTDGEKLVSSNDTEDDRLLVRAADVSGETVLAVMAGPGGELEGVGDFKATPFEMSSDWQVGVGSGEFSWSYPVPMPKPPAGAGPGLTLGYSSGSVDGLTSNRNTQAGPMGLGWGDLANAFVERRYTPCNEDKAPGQATVGDLCWKNNNATLSLNGRAAELLPVPNSNPKAWRMKRDPRWRIEQLTGTYANGDTDKEYWKVTTPDGTQYFFGLGVKLDGTTATSSVWTVPVVANHAAEPCRGAVAGNIIDNLCHQGWRWNLDRVVDPNGNATIFSYNPVTNYYKAVLGLAGWQPYTRSGRLRMIEYGANTGAFNGGTVVPAQARVDVGAVQRCEKLSTLGAGDPAGCQNPTNVQGTTPETRFPDVPLDQICLSPTGAGCNNTVSPTFFTSLRYHKLTTQVLVGGTWKNVDEIALTHKFEDESAGANKHKLYMTGIQRTGVQGTPSITLPGTTFGTTQLDNRAVNTGSTASKMPHHRINTINDEYGRKLTVTYGQPHPCPSPLPTSGWDNNKWNCFRQQYLPEGATDPNWGVFHKYLVTEVKVEDTTGGSPPMTASYAYGAPAGDTTGDPYPAWHFDADAYYKEGDLQWTDWRGYDTVTVTQVAAKTRYRVHRGMHRDRTGTGGETTADVKSLDGSFTTRDFDWLRGNTLDEAKLASDGSVLEGALHEYTHAVTLDDDAVAGNEPHPFKAAVWVGEAKATTRKKKDGGGFIQTRTTTTYNGFLLFPETVYEEGRLDVATDQRCSKTNYVFDGARWMLDFPQSKTLVSGTCSSSTVLMESQTAYDGGAVGAAPTRGNPTNVRSRVIGSTWAETKLTLDALGRPLVITDPLLRNTTTTHTPVTGYPTKTDVTNHLGHKTTTNWLIERQAPASQLDARSKSTTLNYDSLGRLSKVWKPTEATSGPASFEFIYTVDAAKAAPPVIRTRKLQQTTPSTVYVDTWSIYDSLGRERQSQRLSPAAGKVIVTNNDYTDRGLTGSRSMPQPLPGTAGTLLKPTAPDKWDNENVVLYDELARPTWQMFLTEGTHQWLTTNEYGHDTVKVTPRFATGAASSGEVVSTFDAYGNTTKVAEWATPGDAASAKAASYQYDLAGRLTKVTDSKANPITYGYDLAGQRLTMVDRDAGSWTYTYDLAGNQTSVKDARNLTTFTIYDALNRPTSRHAGDVTKPTATWAYDRAGETGLLDGSTRWVRDASGTRAYITDVSGYDDRARPTGRSWVFFDNDLPGLIPPSPDGSPFPVTYEYDKADHLTKTTYPQIGDPGSGGLPQETVTTTYSDLGLPVKVDGTALPADQDYLYAAGYDDRARPQLFGFGQQGAGVGKLWNYSSEQRLARQQAFASGSQLQDREFTYEMSPFGHILERKNTINARTWMDCYTYDDLNRLTKAYSTTHTGDCAISGAGGGDGPYNHAYSYSDDGNITQRVENGNTIAYTYPAGGATSVRPHAPTRLDFPGGGDDMDYTWDANGHMATRVRGGTTETFVWDAERRLSSIETRNATGSSTSWFNYDTEGDRLTRQDVERNTAYLEGHEISVSNGGKVTSVRTYNLEGAPIATRSASGGDDPTKDKVEYLIADNQGSVELSARNSESTPVIDRTYNPYGAKRTGNDAITDRGWIGQIEDRRAEVNYLNNRYYDPKLYRFISPDPMADPSRPQTLNPYAYGINNPVAFADPSGLCPESSLDMSTTVDTGSWLGNQNAPEPCPEPPPYNPPPSSGGGGEGFWDKFFRFGSEMGCRLESMWEGSPQCPGAAPPPGPGRSQMEAFYELTSDLSHTVNEILLGDYERCLADPGISWSCAATLADVVPVLGKLDNVNDARRAITAAFNAAEEGGDARRAANAAADCALSFGAETLVLMANGERKAISEVEVGDFVVATDPETGETGPRQVIATLPHTDQLLALRTRSGEVVTTEDHRYWNESDGEWQESQDLDAGDLLLTPDGDEVRVEGLDWSTVHTAPAYDLTVAGLHTFYVAAGDENVLVHNSGDCTGGIHGIFRGATRDVDIDHVVETGRVFQQADGRRVYVLENSQNSYSAVVLDGASLTDTAVTVMDDVSQSGLDSRIADGRWTPLEDL